eukprot:7388602-Prymnesium_polylepis.1
MACPIGSFCSGGQAFPCGVNTYADQMIAKRSSQNDCIACGPNSLTIGDNHSSVAACVCTANFYRAGKASRDCKPCPMPGSNCSTP